MNTREHNEFLDELDDALLDAIAGFSDGNDDTAGLLEVVAMKVRAAIDTLRLPDGNDH
jgi:hypothetical protein